MALRGKKPSAAKPARVQMLIFGEAGVGKTWGALGFPGCYFVDCEGGANLPHYTRRLEDVGAAYLGPEDGACEFDVVLQEVLELSKGRHEFRTLIIDSFSKLFSAEVQKEHDRLVAAGKAVAFGLDKKPAIAKTRSLIHRMARLDMNCLLICHQKALWLNDQQIGVSFDAWDKLAYELNLVGQVLKQGKERLVKIVKSRFEQFSEGAALPWAYSTFADAFGAQALEAKAEGVKYASEPQVEKLQTLYEMCHVDESAKQTWLDKAGASGWGELTREQAAKCIAALESKVSLLQKEEVGDAF